MDGFNGFIAFLIAISVVPLLLLVAVPLAAWREGRNSPWSFAIGRVISNSFSAIGGAPLAFLAIALVLGGLPSLLMEMAIADLATDSPTVERFASTLGPAYGGILLLRLLLWPLAHGLLVLLALDALAGRAVDLRRAVGTALRRWGFAIALTLLTWIGISIGFMVLVVPGLVLLLNWFVTMPVLFAERTGLFDSFGRSTDLLRGMRWRLLLLLLIGVVLWFLALMMAGVLQATLPDSWMAHAGTVTISTLGAIIAPAVTAAVYHEAVTAKEGRGGRDLDDVFA